jgi:hypothetical protein
MFLLVTGQPGQAENCQKPPEEPSRLEDECGDFTPEVSQKILIKYAERKLDKDSYRKN